MSGAVSNLLKETANANVVWVQFLGHYGIRNAHVRGIRPSSSVHVGQEMSTNGSRSHSCEKVNNYNTNIGSKGR